MKRNSILVDTGPLVALLHRDDPQHIKCDQVAKTLRVPLYTCWPVLTEAAYLLRRHPSAVRTLLSYCDGTMIDILPLGVSDIGIIAALLNRYADQKLDLADACLMHLAQREAFEAIFTLDRRHFSVFRTREGDTLTIIPEIIQ